MICQLTENLLPGDAISDHVRAVDAALRSMGYETGLCVAQGSAEGNVGVHELSRVLREEDLLLYEYSIGSPLNEWFAAQRCRKAIVYHNITPASFLEPYAPKIADAARWGREQLAELAPTLDFALAPSAYNAGELRSLGCADVTVMPILLDLSRYGGEGDRALTEKLSDGKKNILFVGRKAPNKRVEDVMLFADYYAAACGDDCRLVLVGDDSMTRYCTPLRALAKELSVEILWLGRAPQEQLIAAYRSSHLFLCMSEHEGFCVPLLESMLFGVPVLAYAAAAVPETLGGSGELFEKKDFPAVAERMDALLRDEALRARVTEGQKKRLEAFAPERGRDILKKVLEDHGVFPAGEKGADA